MTASLPALPRLALPAASLALALPLFAWATSASGAEDSFDLRAAAERIDARIAERYEEFEVEPHEEIDDAAFVRRIYLSVAGRIPTVSEAREFLNSGYPEKRARLIRDLLDSEAYVSSQYHFWADILRINQRLGGASREAESAYRLWLKDALRSNMPYDRFAYELVSATGYTWENGAVGYYHRDRGMPLDNLSNTVRIFLGTRLECAQCHDHPFDIWTQMDFFQMAAHSNGMVSGRYVSSNRDELIENLRQRQRRDYEEAAGVEGFPFYRDERTLQRAMEHRRFDRTLARFDMEADEFRRRALAGIAAAGGAETAAREIRSAVSDIYRQLQYTRVDQEDRPLRLPHDYQYSDASPRDVVEPVAMFDLGGGAEDNGSLIQSYARWMVHRDNPRFSHVIANRLWKKVFGHGLVEPVDEYTEQTQASHPELFEELAQLMRELDYDMKRYLEVLYNTRAFQRRAHDGEITPGLPYHFAGPVLQRKSAEQVWDSLMALMIEDVDHHMPTLNRELGGIEALMQRHESVERLRGEEYEALMEQAAEVASEYLAAQDRLREKTLAARAEGDDEAARALGRELGRSRGDMRRALAALAFTRVESGADLDGLLAAFGLDQAFLERAESAAPGVRREVEQSRAESRAWQRAAAQFARASELESPARRGHFLREFGQSDRDEIENAASEASVPQALALLNGPIPAMLSNPNSAFASELERAGGLEEKLETVYLALLSREPNERERALLAAEIEASGEQAVENVIWALLNTTQFLFIH